MGLKKLVALLVFIVMMIGRTEAALSIGYSSNYVSIFNGGGYPYDQALAQCPNTLKAINTASAVSLLNAFRWLIFNYSPWPSVSAIWLDGGTNTDGLCPALLLYPPSGLTFMSCNVLNAIACSTLATQLTTATFYVPSVITVTSQTFVSTTSTTILESVSSITTLSVQTDTSTDLITALDTLITYTTMVMTTVLTGTATITLSSLVTVTEFRETTTVERTIVTSSYISGRTTTTTLDLVTTRISLTC